MDATRVTQKCDIEILKSEIETAFTGTGIITSLVTNGVIQLDGSNTKDPNLPDTHSHLTFQWNCQIVYPSISTCPFLANKITSNSKIFVTFSELQQDRTYELSNIFHPSFFNLHMSICIFRLFCSLSYMFNMILFVGIICFHC